MEKTKMEFPELAENSFMWGKKLVTVKPFLTLAEQAALTRQYTNLFFFPVSTNAVRGDSAYDLFGAEYALALSVINMVSDILVYQEDGSIVEGIDTFLYAPNGYGYLKSYIANYDEFRANLDRVVADIKFQIGTDRSVGTVLDRFFNNLDKLFEKLQSVDASDEAIQKLKDAAVEISGTLEKSPIGRVYHEASKPD